MTVTYYTATRVYLRKNGVTVASYPRWAEFDSLFQDTRCNNHTPTPKSA